MVRETMTIAGLQARADRVAAAPIIEVDRISKSFGLFQVLKELSFTVQPGEKLALIGPSGSGKTTILRVLMTLETITGGHVKIEGVQLWHEPRNGGLAPAGERHRQSPGGVAVGQGPRRQPGQRAG